MRRRGDERSPALSKTLGDLGDRAAAMRAMVVPDWLAEVVRPKPTPLPWPQMLRAALAICVPPAAGLALGGRALGVLPATGGILGVMSDTGGPCLNRVKRVASAYMEEALRLPGGSPGSPSEGALPARSRMRRSTYRALADLRTEFQRTMSEPPSISRRATAWWPAVVALERVMDAGTATALAISRGAPAPLAGSVRMLCGALRAVSEAAASGTALAAAPELPDDETLKPVTETVRALLGVLGTGQRLAAAG